MLQLGPSSLAAKAPAYGTQRTPPRDCSTDNVDAALKISSGRGYVTACLPLCYYE